MSFFSEEQYMQDPLVVGLATTLLTQLAKHSKWKWLAWVDPSQPDQVKLVAGGVSLLLILFRRVQAGEINQGNALESVKALVVAWLIAWFVSHFAYQSLPYVRQPAAPTPALPEEKPAQ